MTDTIIQNEIYIILTNCFFRYKDVNTYTGIELSLLPESVYLINEYQSSKSQVRMVFSSVIKIVFISV